MENELLFFFRNCNFFYLFQNMGLFTCVNPIFEHSCIYHRHIINILDIYINRISYTYLIHISIVVKYIIDILVSYIVKLSF